MVPFWRVRRPITRQNVHLILRRKKIEGILLLQQGFKFCCHLQD
uniref:Uncharacterized protein n=1 Tax=Lepeophtheirus salmonis TaxID=72036 RepID=A0A0K2TP69_LEPSM